MEEIAFKYAVDHINRNKLLPKSRVMAQIERIPSHDSFYASKRGLIDQTRDEHNSLIMLFNIIWLQVA